MFTVTHQCIVDMPNITPFSVPVFDLQSGHWLAPNRRKARVIYNEYFVNMG